MSKERVFVAIAKDVIRVGPKRAYALFCVSDVTRKVTRS